jgi:hypothetical protein
MKTKLARVLGLAVLAASFTCGGSRVYADALEATPSAMQALAPDADANGTGSINALPCASYDEGAETCTVKAPLAEVDQPSSPAGAIEPAVTEASSTEDSLAPAIQSADAIVVEVIETVTIAVPGQGAGDSEEAAVTGTIPELPATEPILVVDAKATTDASAAPAIEADAIVAEIVQTVTVAVSGQDAGATEEAAVTGSIPEPSATEPVAVADAKATADASAATAIEAVDAIAVEIVQTAAVAVPGQAEGDSEGPAYTGSIPEATEPVSTPDANGADVLE